ncbi:hypothetical protein ACHAWX_004773 [Stephanocyclus meneghinianus]
MPAKFSTHVLFMHPIYDLLVLLLQPIYIRSHCPIGTNFQETRMTVTVIKIIIQVSMQLLD